MRGAHLVIFTSACKCSPQAHASVPHKRMQVLPTNERKSCPQTSCNLWNSTRFGDYFCTFARFSDFLGIICEQLFSHFPCAAYVQLIELRLKRRWETCIFLLNIVCMSGKMRTFVPVFSGLVKQNEHSNRKI